MKLENIKTVRRLKNGKLPEYVTFQLQPWNHLGNQWFPVTWVCLNLHGTQKKSSKTSEILAYLFISENAQWSIVQRHHASVRTREKYLPCPPESRQSLCTLETTSIAERLHYRAVEVGPDRDSQHSSPNYDGISMASWHNVRWLEGRLRLGRQRGAVAAF